MPVTELHIAQRAFASLVASGGDPATIKIPHLISLIPLGLELLAKRVADSDAYEGLQRDYTATPAAGFLDLDTLANVLFDIDKCRVRVSASNASLAAVDSYETLEHGELALDQVYYAQDGTALRFRDTAGSLVAYATALKVRANYIPSLTDSSYPLPSQYVGALVSQVVELVRGEIQPQEAIETAITGRA